MAFDYIGRQIAERRAAALYRRRVPFEAVTSRTLVFEGREYLNFASNDYLSLGDEAVSLPDAVSGSRSSALVTGYQREHRELEAWLCEKLGYEAALLFNSGFSANSSVLTSLFHDGKTGTDSAIFSDKLNHASLIDGALHANAASVRFNHNDLNHLRSRLEKSKAKNKLIVSEGVFSMDGDKAPLVALSELAVQHSAWLMIDDAHGFGVCGRHGLGSCDALKPELLVITFGKAVASSGACVLASREVIDYLVQYNREYTYSTSMSPLLAKVTLAQLNRVWQADGARSALRDNIALFKGLCAVKGIPVMESDSAIQPIVLGDAEATLAASERLKEKGVWLTAIRPPTVPHNTARLRVTLTAGHRSEDIETLVASLEQQL